MCGDGRTLPGLPHGVQSRLWCPCLCGRAVSSKGELHHQTKKALDLWSGAFCIAPSAGHSLQATLSKRSQSWRLPRTFPFSNCFRPAQLARWSAFPPLQDGSPARRHPRHRLRYLQLGHVRAPGARRSAHDFARRRCTHFAHRPVSGRQQVLRMVWESLAVNGCCGTGWTRVKIGNQSRPSKSDRTKRV